MSQPFRFGVQAFSADTAAEWTDIAKSAEDLGYSCLSLADHYLGPGPAAKAASHSPQTLAAIPAMTMAAAVTTEIMIGSRVMCCDYHHPLVLAMELATIDVLSEGRLEAGFGAGWVTSEYEAMGLDMDRPGVRIDRLIEYVELARAFFNGEELDFDGEHVKVNSMLAVPASVQEGGPKVLIGGGSPRVLRTAGRMADIVSINFDNSEGKIGAHGIGSGTAAGTARKVGWIRDGAGDRFDEIEIEIGAYFTTVTDNPQETLEAMGPALGLEPAELAQHPHALIGSVEAICELLHQRREEYGVNYVTVGGRNMEAFAPVVASLAGK